jgi:hypothetical protein
MSGYYKPYEPKREKRLLIVDIEGYRDLGNERIEAYLVGVYDGTQFFLYRNDDCVKDFLDKFLTLKYRGHVFYSHFGSLFDFPLILDELNKRSYLNIYPIMKGSKIIKMSVIDKSDHRWYFQDSGALLNFSLDSLTKTFNVGHKKLEVVKKGQDYDWRLYDLYRKKPNEVIEYLYHDCVGLYEVLEKFKQEMLSVGGSMGITMASTALKTFNHGYQSKPLFMCSKDLNDELRQALYGGRTEIFRMVAPEKSSGYYYYYDVNSLYPFVMRNNTFPISRPEIVMEPPAKIFLENDGITHAKVVSPADLYVPLLPAKIQIGYDSKLMFVLGSYEGWWDNSLLKKAWELGYKIEPLKSYVFQSEEIFKEYVDKFYSIKQNSKSGTPQYMIAKLLMNSLFGKFGQRQVMESIIKDPFPDPEEFLVKEIIDEETGWCKVEQEGKGKFYLPQISIHVTALAQIELYKIFEKILEKGYRLFYCDTDSVTTDYKDMPVSDKLGDLKRERRVRSAYFLLPKTYRLVDDKGEIELRAKGYSRSLQKKIRANAFEKAIFYGDTSGFTVQSDDPEMLRANAAFRRFKDFNKLDYVRRSIQTRYNKRFVLKDFNTRPFHMNELVDLNPEKSRKHCRSNGKV